MTTAMVIHIKWLNFWQVTKWACAWCHHKIHNC